MFKKAFTMLELVFVIVVVGILAVAMVPRFDRNELLEAADQLAMHIRYAQHLAMSDNTFGPDVATGNYNTWFQRRWGIRFNTLEGENRYTICKKTTPDLGGGCNSADGIANDPQNPSKLLSGGYDGRANANNLNSKLNLTRTFGVNEVALNCGGGAQTITFDHTGKPYAILAGALDPNDRALVNPCLITLSKEDGKSASIVIYPESGYVEIWDYPDNPNPRTAPPSNLGS